MSSSPDFVTIEVDGLVHHIRPKDIVGYSLSPETASKLKEQAAREQAAREQAAREQAAREQAAREQAAREYAAREYAAREQAAREQAAREQAAREYAAREQAAREYAAREQAAREQAAREQAARGQDRRNQVSQKESSSNLAQRRWERQAFKARGEAGVRYGNDRTIMLTELWAPLGQTINSVLYTDLRFMQDSLENDEFNLGLGFRKLLNNKIIIGGNGWIDQRKTAYGSQFTQITTGLEIFGENNDFRMNFYYVPNNKGETYTASNPEGVNEQFSGHQIVLNTDQVFVEEALSGLDFEVGQNINFFPDTLDSARLYVGGYHFVGDMAKSLTGWRTRFNVDVTPNIQVGARVQSDNIRGLQGFLEGTVRFPFDYKQSYQTEGLRARLDESPERDIDIVSNNAMVDNGLNKTLTNASTNSTQNIIHVDNTAAGGGDGSAESPYNTLAAAETAAAEHDLIYVHKGDGTSTGLDAGITLDDEGQMLVGSGSSFSFNRQTFGTSNGVGVSRDNLFVGDTSDAPIITNTGGDAVVVKADNVDVSGIRISGASGRGLMVSRFNDAYVSDVYVDGNSGAAVFVYQSNNTVINNAQIFHGDAEGIRIQESDGVTVQNTEVINTTAPAYGPHADGCNCENIYFLYSDNGKVLNSRTEKGNAGVFADYSDNIIISGFESYDQRGFSTHPWKGNGIQVNNSDNPLIENFKIVSDPETSFFGDSLSIHDTSNATIRNGFILSTTHPNGAGIQIEEAGSYNAYVENVQIINFVNQATGVSQGAKDVTFVNIYAANGIPSADLAAWEGVNFRGVPSSSQRPFLSYLSDGNISFYDSYYYDIPNAIPYYESTVGDFVVKEFTNEEKPLNDQSRVLLPWDL